MKKFVFKHFEGQPREIEKQIQAEFDTAVENFNGVEFGAYEFQCSDVDRDYHHAYLTYSYEA